MWFKINDEMVNQDNVESIHHDAPHGGHIRVFAKTITGDNYMLGIFETSEQVARFVNMIKDQIGREVIAIDVTPLANLVKMQK